MKHLKLLGVAVVAALTLVAVIGSATASAKVCSTAGTGAACGATDGTEYAGAFTATATNATFVSGFVTAVCTDSVQTGDITNSATGAGTITGLTFTGCTHNLGSGGCVASTTASATAPWTASVIHTTGTNGTLTVLNVTSEFTCTILGSAVKCLFKASSAVAEVHGGEPAVIKETNVALEKEAGSNSLCSSTAGISASYVVVSPTSLFVT
jgi:hypothetical protein